MQLIIKNLDNHQQLGFNNKEVDLTTKLLGAWTLKIHRFLTDQRPSTFESFWKTVHF